VHVYVYVHVSFVAFVVGVNNPPRRSNNTNDMTRITIIGVFQQNHVSTTIQIFLFYIGTQARARVALSHALIRRFADVAQE
jgi:hypothetical protein